MKTGLRRTLWIALAALLVLLIVRTFQPTPVLVDVAEIARGTLRITADDDGRTRVRERYTVGAPVAGRLLRTALEPGDEVRRGETVLAEFEPLESVLLDARSRREAEARLAGARAALAQARTRLDQARTEHEFAEVEARRVRALFEREVAAREELDRVERAERRAFQDVRAADFAVQVASHEVEVVEATLLEPGEPDELGDPEQSEGPPARADGVLTLRSPIDGRVLRVFEESARTLPAGAPILELGDTDSLEIVADFLSQEAVKLAPGMPVRVEGWGGVDADGAERVLRGRVRLVEPSGFTKISALGVEEQRVDVLVDPEGPAEDWAGLGDGYRVELRVLLWDEEDVLLVPTGALFRAGDEWAVFRVEADRAVQRTVTLGRRGGLEAEVAGGLVAGDRVVLYPSELVDDGTLVELR